MWHIIVTLIYCENQMSFIATTEDLEGFKKKVSL